MGHHEDSQISIPNPKLAKSGMISTSTNPPLLKGYMSLVTLVLIVLVDPVQSYRQCRGGWIDLKPTWARVSLRSSTVDNAALLAQSMKTIEMLRGGADVEEEVDDEETEGEAEEIEYDDESEYEDDEEDEEADESASSSLEMSNEYVEPFHLTPSLSIYATIFSMMLAQRVDLFSPAVVRFVRFLYVLQIVAIQLFILYARITAKKKNDRTPVVVDTPISGFLKAQLDAGGNDMVKNLASSFLSSSSTILEYDLKQANNLQGSLIFTMVFMWLLHFKMDMVQPLVQQVVVGYLNFVFNPLFQVYILGRNLERPFKTPVSAAQRMADEAAQTGDQSNSKVDEDVAADEAEDESSAEVDDEEDVDDGADENEEEDADGDDDRQKLADNENTEDSEDED